MLTIRSQILFGEIMAEIWLLSWSSLLDFIKSLFDLSQNLLFELVSLFFHVLYGEFVAKFPLNLELIRT